MTEQEENELICEKLLGWKRTEPGYWHGGDFFCRSTAHFVNGQDAEWLWLALRADGVIMNIYTVPMGRWKIEGFVRENDHLDRYQFCDVLEATLPLAFRAVALAYIRVGKDKQQ